METLELTIGQSRRQLRLIPRTEQTFDIYAVDKAEDWLDHERARQVDLPEDGRLGTITVRTERDFDFDGVGAFTGQELQSIAAQLTRHPSFKADSPPR